MERRMFLSAVTMAALGAMAGCLGRGRVRNDDVSQAVKESFDPDDVDEIVVINDIGNVSIAALDVSTIESQVLKRSTNGQVGLDDIEVTTTVEDGILTVETAIDRNARWFTKSSPSTDVTITLPQGIAGPAVSEVSSELGEITLIDTRGDTVARTDLGDVSASGVDGYLTLESRLGTVLASDVTGINRVHTDLGNVKIDLLSVRGDVDVGTNLGDVVVGVADDLDLDIEVESDGGISSDLSLSDLRSSGGHFSGRLNRGGSRFRVSSDLGKVSLRSIQR